MTLAWSVVHRVDGKPVDKIELSDARSTLMNVHPPLAERAVEVLPWLVGFYLSFRVFIMLLSVRWFRLEADTGVAVNLTLNYLLLGLVLYNSPPPTHRSPFCFTEIATCALGDAVSLFFMS
jgi:hypothetical protein